jgi:3-deoxy-manno-octulosonate cytidylyltransferase (CMP-KDO synthetase)
LRFSFFLTPTGAGALQRRALVVRFVVPPRFSPQIIEALRQAPAVAIIPARYESTRLPGKALADIGGRPMVEHVYRRTATARSIGAVIVATDDQRIVDAVERFGGNVCLTKATHQSGTDRIAEVAEGLDCPIVVNVQGDEPLIDPASIDAAVAPFASDPDLQMSTLRYRLDDAAEALDPNAVKVVVDRNGYALYFSRTPIPFVGLRRPSSFNRAGAPPPARSPRVGDGSGLFYKHIGLYAYRREFLLRFSRLEPTPLERAERLEQLRALEHGFRIRTVETRHDSIGVDSEADLARVRQLTHTFTDDRRVGVLGVPTRSGEQRLRPAPSEDSRGASERGWGPASADKGAGGPRE